MFNVHAVLARLVDSIFYKILAGSAFEPFRASHQVRWVGNTGSAAFAQTTFLGAVTKSWCKWGFCLYSITLDHRTLNKHISYKLSIISYILCVPSNWNRKTMSKSWLGLVIFLF